MVCGVHLIVSHSHKERLSLEYSAIFAFIFIPFVIGIILYCERDFFFEMKVAKSFILLLYEIEILILIVGKA